VVHFAFLLTSLPKQMKYSFQLSDCISRKADEQSGAFYWCNSHCFYLSDEQDEETVATGGKVTAAVSY